MQRMTTIKMELPHIGSDVIVSHFGGLSPHCIQNCRAVLRAGARCDLRSGPNLVHARVNLHGSFLHLTRQGQSCPMYRIMMKILRCLIII